MFPPKPKLCDQRNKSLKLDRIPDEPRTNAKLIRNELSNWMLLSILLVRFDPKPFLLEEIIKIRASKNVNIT